jgi:hypothetical protein
MATLLLEPPPLEQPQLEGEIGHAGRWLVFRYSSVSLFSLKSSRATSTAGKTLLTPTPYAVKMAFLDAALRHGLAESPDDLVRWLAAASLRIGVPRHACVTGTIQSVRQETRDVERKRKPDSPPYRSSIALREVVHHSGTIGAAFDLNTCSHELIALLLQTAPAINYFGKRGGFMQYVSGVRQRDLDLSFTLPVDDLDTSVPPSGHRSMLDDFGARASFDALNSFTATEVRRNVDRRFVETIIPLEVYNSGPGFTHYSLSGAML